MFESKRMTSEFGPPRIGQSETRKPLLWIKRQGEEVFLINAGNEPLTFACASTGGFVSSDDGAHTIGSDSVAEYQEIAPNVLDGMACSFIKTHKKQSDSPAHPYRRD